MNLATLCSRRNVLDRRRLVLTVLEEAAPAFEWEWDAETETSRGTERYLGERRLSSSATWGFDGLDDLTSLLAVEAYVERRGDVIVHVFFNARFASPMLGFDVSLRSGPAVNPTACVTVDRIGDRPFESVDRLRSAGDEVVGRLRDAISHELAARVEYVVEHCAAVGDLLAPAGESDAAPTDEIG